MNTMKLFALAMVALAMLHLLGQSAEVSEVDIAAIERHLKAATQDSCEGDSEAALQRIRKASRCDSVDDAVATEPFGITTSRLIGFQLRLALNELQASQWWRAVLLSQHVAGCYSVTLMKEVQTAIVERGDSPPQSP